MLCHPCLPFLSRAIFQAVGEAAGDVNVVAVAYAKGRHFEDLLSNVILNFTLAQRLRGERDDCEPRNFIVLDALNKLGVLINYVSLLSQFQLAT